MDDNSNAEYYSLTDWNSPFNATCCQDALLVVHSLRVRMVHGAGKDKIIE